MPKVARVTDAQTRAGTIQGRNGVKSDMISNREAANKIVQEICTTLMQLPSEKDWKKLVDFTERQIEAAQQGVHADAVKSDMMDYELSDTECPKCGHEPTHYRHCVNIGCNDGWIDMHEYDDPLWYDLGEIEKCDECNGTGIEAWCPNCGWDLSNKRYMNGKAEVKE